MNFRVRNVASIGLRTRWNKERIVLAPYRKQRWAMAAEISLKLGIARHIAAVIQNQVQLDVVRARASHIGDIQRIAIRRHAPGRRTMEVLQVTDHLRRQGLTAGFPMRSRRFAPIRLPTTPVVAETIQVGVAVLADDGRYTFGVRYRQTQASRCAIVEDIQRVMFQADRVDEQAHDAREFVEAVVERPAGRGLGLSEARQVGSDHAIVLRQLRDQVAKHVTGGGEPMQQQNDGGVGGTGLAIEHLYVADLLGMERHRVGMSRRGYGAVSLLRCSQRSGGPGSGSDSGGEYSVTARLVDTFAIDIS